MKVLKAHLIHNDFLLIYISCALLYYIGYCFSEAKTVVTMQDNPSYIPIEDGVTMEPNPPYSPLLAKFDCEYITCEDTG